MPVGKNLLPKHVQIVLHIKKCLKLVQHTIVKYYEHSYISSKALQIPFALRNIHSMKDPLVLLSMKSVLLTLAPTGVRTTLVPTGGADNRPPRRSRKRSKLETSGKRHWIRTDKLYNFY